MDAGKLVHMANEIASFFRAYPDAEASAGISNHIRLFWTPRMRQALSARIAMDHAGVEPLVVQAFRERNSGESPIKEALGPDILGQMASDAG